MTTIVTGLYDNANSAEKARQALMTAGCREQDIDLFGGDTDIKASLSREGFEQDEIQDYSQAVQQGCIVMLAHVDDDAADQAVETMRRHGTRQLEDIVSQGQPQTESLKEVEEAEVRKAARQIGEVNLSKTSETREETVRDTARRTEVEVEKIQTGSQSRDPSKTDPAQAKKSPK